MNIFFIFIFPLLNQHFECLRLVIDTSCAWHNICHSVTNIEFSLRCLKLVAIKKIFCTAYLRTVFNLCYLHILLTTLFYVFSTNFCTFTLLFLESHPMRHSLNAANACYMDYSFPLLKSKMNLVLYLTSLLEL